MVDELLKLEKGKQCQVADLFFVLRDLSVLYNPRPIMADTTSSHTCTHLVKVSRIKFYASNACGFVGYLLSLLCSRISHIQIFSPRVSVSYVSIIHFELQIENRKFHKYVFSFRVLLQCAFGG